jgi:prolyl-tRNA synthetase
MKQSSLFTKTLKQNPSDEVSQNAQLLIRAGYVYKELSGVFAYLPLGLKVLDKIINVIRQEMNSLGAQELLLTALQSPFMWQATDRWDDDKVDVWFKTALRDGTALGLAFTHEEPLTAIMTNHIQSYRDLPVYVYQFQTKFRNEARAKSGVMRLREFIMKDLYSFCPDEKSHQQFYEQVKDAYLRIFNRLGLAANTYLTFAAGGSFSRFSHEFQAVTSAGEDIIYISEKKNIAINREVLNDEVLIELGLSREDLIEKKAVEVGNIFSLGTKFSQALGLSYTDENGKKQPVIMGSYGLGPGRIMGALVETKADKNGLVWPASVSPFQVHLLVLSNDAEKLAIANNVYQELEQNGFDVLFDDRDLSAGEKLVDADLIGIHLRLLIGTKTDVGKIEYKLRDNSDAGVVDISNIHSLIKRVYGGLN